MSHSTFSQRQYFNIVKSFLKSQQLIWFILLEFIIILLIWIFHLSSCLTLGCLTMGRKVYPCLLAYHLSTLQRMSFLMRMWRNHFRASFHESTLLRTLNHHPKWRHLFHESLHLPTIPHILSHCYILQFLRREVQICCNWYRLHTVFLLCKQFSLCFRDSC